MIECCRHGSRLDLRTGAVIKSAASKSVHGYPTRVDDGQVYVDVGGQGVRTADVKAHGSPGAVLGASGAESAW